MSASGYQVIRVNQATWRLKLYLMCGKALRFVVIILAGCMIPGLVMSEIYRWVDESGKVYFSDEPSHVHTSEVVKLRINTYKAVTYDTSSIDVGKSVVMCSASWCGVCKKARRYFEQKGIRFTEYDVETSARGKSDYRQLGEKGCLSYSLATDA